MAIDLTDARQAAAPYLLGDTCVIVRPGTATSDGGGGLTTGAPATIGPLACAFRAVSGTEAVDDVIAVRGAYRLKLAVDVDIRPTDQVDVLGGRYHVVWAPPAAALSLFRIVGLADTIGGA